MKDTELKEMRDRALYQVYLQGLEEGRFNSMREAGEYVRKQPAPQFFLSSRVASLYIGMIMQGISLLHLNSLSRRRIWTLYDRYVEWKRENASSTLSRERICEILVEEPAPEFYVTMEQARKSIWKEWKKAREKWYGR